MKYIKTLILIALLIPQITFGAVAVGWNATSTASNLLYPNYVNGVLKVPSANEFRANFFTGGFFRATSTTASIFPLANITKLSNLTGNGFVKTSGGDGTLSVDTTTYESGLTAGDGMTRTANDFDCDTASGSVFGCLSSTDWTTFNNKGSGTVTSVDVSGGTTGLTYSGGPITTSGTITMAGTLGVANGGTASTTNLGGILAGNGASAIKSVIIGTNLTFDGSTLNATGGASTTLLADMNTFSTAGTTTFNNGIKGGLLNITSTTASSTFANGLNLTGGCFSINGTCVGAGVGGGSGTVTTITAGSGITLSSGATCTTTCTISATGGGTNYFTNIANDTILNTGTTLGFPALNATSTTIDSYFIKNVGIGTTTPIAKLAVAEGSIHVSEFTVSTSTAITVDWASTTPSVSSNQQLIRIGTSAITLNMKSYNAGQSLKLVVCNPSSGTAGTITWDSNILWPGGVQPGQTTAVNKCDVWSFIATYATSTLKIFGGVTTSF